MNKKNPCEIITGILQILVSDKKRIGFLCGAGTSFAKKDKTAINIPNVSGITEEVVNKIKNETKYSSAIDEIVGELDNFNIERILDLLEKKIDAVGNSKLNGLAKGELISLRAIIHDAIYDIVSVITSETKKTEIVKLPHNDLVNWIRLANRKYPIEIFTTNYDYFFESAFEINEIPYYDGFTGSLNPFFHPLSVEDFAYLPSEAKLWKIHGSVGWKQIDDRVIRTKNDTGNKDLLIFPSSLKYSNSKKMPYVSLIDRLCSFIEQKESVLFVIGYSFGDEHINERIITSLKKSHNSQVFAFVYDKTNLEGKAVYLLEKEVKFKELGKQSPKISFIGMKSAIIGGQYYTWHLGDYNSFNLNLFNKILTFNDKNMFDELVISDFVKFVDFLSEMTAKTCMEEI